MIPAADAKPNLGKNLFADHDSGGSLESTPNGFPKRLSFPYQIPVINLHQRSQFAALRLIQFPRLLAIKQLAEALALRFVHPQVSRCQHFAVGKLLDRRQNNRR